MNETEYEEYLNKVFGMNDLYPNDAPLAEPLRDEYGYIVPGCYRTLPAPVEE